MPSIKDKSTVDAIAKAFTSNGRNAELALKAVGYTDSYAEHRSKCVLYNVVVKQAIAEIDAKTEEKLDLSRAGQHAKLKDAYDVAKTAKNPAAMTSAIREQNEMLGYHREKGLNPEKEAARLARMSDEERETARLVAKMRTDEEAKTVPIRGRKQA